MAIYVKLIPSNGWSNSRGSYATPNSTCLIFGHKGRCWAPTYRNNRQEPQGDTTEAPLNWDPANSNFFYTQKFHLMEFPLAGSPGRLAEFFLGTGNRIRLVFEGEIKIRGIPNGYFPSLHRSILGIIPMVRVRVIVMLSQILFGQRLIGGVNCLLIASSLGEDTH
jgi:hypothetical protein